MSDPPPNPRPSRLWWIIPALLAVLLLLGDLIIELVANEIQAPLRQALGERYRTFLYAALAFFALLAILLAIRERRAHQAEPDSKASASSGIQISGAVSHSAVQTAGGDIQTTATQTGGGPVIGGGVIAEQFVGRDQHVHVQHVQLPPSGPQALHQLPAPPSDFTGRVAELRELTEGVKEGGATISGLRGMGGVGKTALALKLADQLRPGYPDAQFYLDLKGSGPQPISSAEALSHVLRAYYPAQRLPDAQAELESLYRSALEGRRVLLLMDNAASAGQVVPLIPPSGCLLLVTSRQRFSLPGLHAIDIDALPLQDARALLHALTPRTDERADEIADLCGRLPLALRLSGSALRERPDLSAADYVRRLSDAQTRLKNLDAASDLAGAPGVEASLSLSYDLLTPALQHLWRTLSAFPGGFDCPAAVAVWEIEGDAAQDALGALIGYSLLDWDGKIERYRLHDLARLFADARLSADERTTAQRRHAAHYEDILSTAKDLYLRGGEALTRGLVLFDREWGNVRAGQAWVVAHAGEGDEAARLCSAYPNAGVYCLALRQHPRERIQWRQAALSAAQRLRDRSAEGAHLGNLGLAYADLGEPRKAIQYYEQHLTITREIGDRRGEGNALGNLGLAYADLGEPRKAIQYYEQRLTIARKIGDRRGEGHALWNKSLALDRLKNRSDAIACAEAALAIYEQIEHPSVDKVREQIAEWRGNP